MKEDNISFDPSKDDPLKYVEKHRGRLLHDSEVRMIFFDVVAGGFTPSTMVHAQALAFHLGIGKTLARDIISATKQYHSSSTAIISLLESALEVAETGEPESVKKAIRMLEESDPFKEIHQKRARSVEKGMKAFQAGLT